MELEVCLLAFRHFFADYWFALQIVKIQKYKKQFVLLSISTPSLGFSNISNFFVGNAIALAHLFGVELSEPTVQIILPVGVSFFTFQSLSYTIEAARLVRDLAICVHLLDFVSRRKFRECHNPHHAIFMARRRRAAKLPSGLVYIAPGLLLLQWLSSRYRFLDQLEKLGPRAFSFPYGSLWALSIAMLPLGFRPFIYFQF